MSGPVDVHALVGAYALDAVDDIERATVERHLRECAACAAEAAELRETAAALAATVAQPPPVALRATVLDAIGRQPQLPRVPGPGEPPAVGRGTGPRAGGVGSAGGRSWTRRRALTVAVAAAVAVAVTTGVTTWAVAGRDRGPDGVTAADRAIAAVLTAPDASVHTDTLAGGRVSVVVSPARDEAVVLAEGLPALPTGRVYQLWMLGGSTPVRDVGTLPVGSGHGTVFVDDLGGAAEFGLSREPAGGSPTPTDVALKVQLA